MRDDASRLRSDGRELASSSPRTSSVRSRAARWFRGIVQLRRLRPLRLARFRFNSFGSVA